MQFVGGVGLACGDAQVAAWTLAGTGPKVVGCFYVVKGVFASCL